MWGEGILRETQQTNDLIQTGVCWCEMHVTSELRELVVAARENERALQGQIRDPESVARAVAIADVDAAKALAADPALNTEELFARCFALKGEPLNQAPARRDMRERIRIWRRLTRGDTQTPRSVDELFALWEEAVAGEYPVYRESATAGFRTGIPFVEAFGRPRLAEIPPEKETVAPADIARETDALLAFLGRSDIEAELHAAAAAFALVYIHPFRDGNGHTHRMLTCSMLAKRYSPATLLTFVRARQAARHEESRLIERIVQERADIGAYARFVLEKLCEAQESLRLRQ